MSPTVSRTTKSPTPQPSPFVGENQAQMRLLEAIVVEAADVLPTRGMSQPSSSRTTLDNPVQALSDRGVTSPGAVRDQMQDFILRRLQQSNMDQVRAFLVSSYVSNHNLPVD